ncbi:hypothetical protein TBK1r_74330 [Stieleria magnilauensis]|uniref:Uncharacterized protein n=1 Tax=Stieleria magnilauensis TaxID=2527963 RepID=A0ABX5Y4E9_9BACT|nr:hypothetical protein TBK1r_74330 [Planctomycetes bacterium TBK1r]
MKVAKNVRSLFSKKTEPAEKFLRSLSITADQPGPILSDANALLDFLDGPPTPTGNQNFVLPMKLLKSNSHRPAARSRPRMPHLFSRDHATSKLGRRETGAAGESSAETRVPNPLRSA